MFSAIFGGNMGPLTSTDLYFIFSSRSINGIIAGNATSNILLCQHRVQIYLLLLILILTLAMNFDHELY